LPTFFRLFFWQLIGSDGDHNPILRGITRENPFDFLESSEEQYNTCSDGSPWFHTCCNSICGDGFFRSRRYYLQGSKIEAAYASYRCQKSKFEYPLVNLNGPSEVPPNDLHYMSTEIVHNKRVDENEIYYCIPMRCRLGNANGY